MGAICFIIDTYMTIHEHMASVKKLLRNNMAALQIMAYSYSL